MPKRKTHNEFLDDLRKINPNVEVLTEYNGDKNYITVKCLIDGNVWKTKPRWLMKGVGCQICYDRRRGDKTRFSVDKFIEKARKVHGDKYDYSKVEYKNNKTKVCIICPVHGEFEMRPDHHLSGQGCPKCANKYITTEEWIDNANEMHKNFYNYSLVEYKNNRTPIKIICPKHGEFWQTPDKHLSGQGCPICCKSKLETVLTSKLNEEGLKFEYQKRFDWLGKQSLDFYLPDYNIAIECQGIQHFEPVAIFGGEEEFNLILKRDINKNFLCHENGVRLIYLLDSKLKISYDLPCFLGIYNNNTYYSDNILKNIL